MSIDIISQDFDTIRASITASLKTKYPDYNWEYEGECLSLVLDICANLAYKLNIYNSAALNEVFLSTAQTRNATIRSAKELNYNIASPTAARATLDLVFNPSSYVSSITIPKYTKFTAALDSTTYEFITTQAYTVIPDVDNKYEISIEVVQGSVQTYTWNVSNSQKIFTIPNTSVDTSLLNVYVKQNASDELYTTYTKATNITELTENSYVYYVQEGANEYFEIYFGDDICGKSIADGNVVYIEYIVTDATSANGISSFTLADSLTYTPTITVSSVSQGGKDIETIDSIKFYAPKNYAAQERMVTEEDYQVILKQNFTQIDSLNAWGGEDNDPAYYGYVCLSALTKSNYELSETLKDEISASCEDNYIIGSKRIKWIEPQIIYLLTNITTYFNRKVTSSSPADLVSKIETNLATYESNNIDDFKKTFKYTPFTSYVKSIDSSFTDVLCNIILEAKITPTLGSSVSYSVPFLNTVNSGTLSSDPFYDSSSRICYLDDDSAGNVRIYTTIDNVKTILNATAGTINYTTGKVAINSLNIKSLYSDSTFKITLTPSSYNVVSSLNNILKFDLDNSTISVVKDVNA